LHGLKASLAYDGTENLLRIRSVGWDSWDSLSVPPDEEDAFSRWVRHIQDGTRANDNLARAVELTRLVVASNSSAASGSTARYSAGA
jgi:1,5-anhydro-D-fructose reductase (1,5-anhydro-D-mannitol-forming)